MRILRAGLIVDAVVLVTQTLFNRRNIDGGAIVDEPVLAEKRYSPVRDGRSNAGQSHLVHSPEAEILRIFVLAAKLTEALWGRSTMMER